MSKYKLIGSFILGTAVKIVVKLNINTPTSAKITIDDPTDTERVSSANMTKDANKVYSYVYQSSTSYSYGEYRITIKITNGDYTSVSQNWFELKKQEGV